MQQHTAGPCSAHFFKCAGGYRNLIYGTYIYMYIYIYIYIYLGVMEQKQEKLLFYLARLKSFLLCRLWILEFWHHRGSFLWD